MDDDLVRKRSIPYVAQLAHWDAPLRAEKQSRLESFTTKSSDGLSLFGVSAGNANGPAIVFIHGYSQCHLAWRRQFSDPELTARFRLVAYDLRGHGGSDKPPEAERYRDDRLWADDLAAIIGAANVKQPVVVAWSYGGRVVSDFLRFYSQDSLSGINYVAAVTKSDRAFWGSELRHTEAMALDDLATNIRASRKLVQACFANRPVSDEFEMTFAYTMLAPAQARAGLLRRPRNDGSMLEKLRLKVLVTHGSLDRLVLPVASAHTASVISGARLSLYGGVGHSPFFEDAPRFNRELAEFVYTAAFSGKR
jgi:pimeloyl-ACP methyl ester carboxylesterase